MREAHPCKPLVADWTSFLQSPRWAPALSASQPGSKEHASSVSLCCVWHLSNIKSYIFNAWMFIAGNGSKKHAERGVFALKAFRGYESVWITLQVEYTTKLVAQLSLQPAKRQNWRWWLLQDVLDRWPYVVLGGWWALLCTVQGRPHGETPTKCWVSSARPCMTKRLHTAPRRSGWNVPGGCVCTSHPLAYP